MTYRLCLKVMNCFKKRKNLLGMLVNFFPNFIDIYFAIKFVIFRMQIYKAQGKALVGIVEQINKKFVDCDPVCEKDTASATT